jgi:CheY-like chemotaxis protein
VLIVDDDPDIRFLFTESLVRAGHEVVGVAVDGEDALAKAALLARDIDLILLDVLMPVMDGIAALPKLRAIVPTTTKIVFVTALLGNNLVAQQNSLGLIGEENGPDGILFKTRLLKSADVLSEFLD